MKRLLLFIILLIPFIIACSSVDKSIVVKNRASLAKDIRIAVLPFKNATNQPDSGTAVADALASEIVKIPNWDVVERSQLEKITNEQTLDMTGLTVGDINKIGKLSKTDFIIVGSVSEYSYERKFLVVPKTKLAYNIRIIDTVTGSVAGTARYSVETGKNAWCGCCLLGWYYIPILLLTDENINRDVHKSVSTVSREIYEQIKKHADYRKS